MLVVPVVSVPLVELVVPLSFPLVDPVESPSVASELVVHAVTVNNAKHPAANNVNKDFFFICFIF
jgi:hypothetical protein